MDFDQDSEICNQTIFEFYYGYLRECKELIEKYTSDLTREIFDYLRDNAQHLAIIILLYIAFSFCFYYCLMKTKLVRQVGEIRNCKNILFVTSHPDDECMFFGPSIITLTRKPGANVYLLCLSKGDYQNLGRIRKEELYSSCKILGIPESNVQIINSSLLPDNPTVNWNEEVIAQIILNFIEVYSIDTVITFDKYGVSNHPNHISIFYAVAYLCLEKQLPKNCTPYALESVSKLRKYVAYLDLPLSFLLSSIKYVVPMETGEVIRSAMRAHKSQYIWFRKALGKVNIAIYRFALENDPERVATMKGRTNLSNDASFFAVSKTERERDHIRIAATSSASDNKMESNNRSVSTSAAPVPPRSVSKTSNTGVKGIVAGGITGGLEICITYPTEFVKTQLQLDEKGSKTGGAKQYNGIIDCVKKTVQTRGFFGLYRGLSVLLYGSIPKSAVRFGAFETLKKRAADENGNLTARTRLLCGLGAGVSEAIFAVTPMETLKVKFINDQRSASPRYRGFFHGTRLIIQEQGFSGVYQGLTATILKQGSNQAIRFFVVESLKDEYKKRNPEEKSPPKLLVGLFGAVGGAASVFGNTPIDVVKTRMQGLEAQKYKSTIDCFAKIWKNEGPFAFYKGTVPRLSRVCLDVGITFMIYDSFMELFNKVWP